jgi:uncharacterized protein YoxC
MKTLSTKKLILIFSAVFVVGLIIIVLLPHGKAPSMKTVKARPILDAASGDTAVETIKTLTENVNTVEAQNKQLTDNNAKFQSDTETKMQQFQDTLHQQLSDLQAQLAEQKSAVSKSNDYTVNNSHATTWIDDLQTSNAANGTTAQSSATTSPTTTSQTTSWGTNNGVATPPLDPYYTLPVNATLTGAVAMQPIIGRIPINGQVPDPYHFKVIIGSKNLAANGVDIPSDVAGIVASGVASGDMLGSCARGRITSLTFVFQDGTISTTEGSDSDSLGEIAAANGNPCISGDFHTNAPLFLSGTVLLAGAQGYANALSQAQTSTTTPTSTAQSITTIIGNSGTYAAGQAASSAAQAAQQWWQARAQNSFDYVFVPNVDPDTGAFLKLNINLTKAINIDYNPTGRKVSYEHNSKKSTTTLLA